MASCCQPCEWCGMTPCVGEDCPSGWHGEHDLGVCDLCGISLRVGEVDGICAHCAARDHVTGEYDILDQRDHEADQ